MGASHPGIGLYSCSKTYFLRRRLELSTESVADKDSTESTAVNSWDSQSPAKWTSCVEKWGWTPRAEKRTKPPAAPPKAQSKGYGQAKGRATATSAVLAILLELLWLPSRSIFHACVEASLSTSCTWKSSTWPRQVLREEQVGQYFKAISIQISLSC